MWKGLCAGFVPWRSEDSAATASPGREKRRAHSGSRVGLSGRGAGLVLFRAGGVPPLRQRPAAGLMRRFAENEVTFYGQTHAPGAGFLYRAGADHYAATCQRRAAALWRPTYGLDRRGGGRGGAAALRTACDHGFRRRTFLSQRRQPGRNGGVGGAGDVCGPHQYGSAGGHLCGAPGRPPRPGQPRLFGAGGAG